MVYPGLVVGGGGGAILPTKLLKGCQTKYKKSPKNSENLKSTWLCDTYKKNPHWFTMITAVKTKKKKNENWLIGEQ